MSSSRSGEGQRGIADKTFHDLDWQRICDAVSQRCLGQDAAELAEDLGLLPDVELCERRRQEVAESAAGVARGVSPPLRGFDALGNALLRARKNDLLNTDDLARIGASADAATRVRGWSRTAQALPLIQEHCRQLGDVSDVAAEISRCIEPGGQIADAASHELGPMRRRVARLRESILGRLDRIAKSPRYDGILQDDYVTIRDERYVLPVRAGEKGDFPGIVHGQSGSGQTLFIEPQELIDANNDLRIAQLDVENEIRRILRRLSDMVAKRADALETNQDVLTYLDLTFAMARLCDDLHCSLPALDDSDARTIRLRDARHPVLALRHLEGDFDVVANDIELVDACGLVVSGPNTGGKTVTLKTLGLCALMTRAGLMLPVAPDSVIPWFAQIHSDIGDEQGVDRDLSTFSGHVANIAGFLPDVARGSLVLLDELFAGTDPEQGTALGRSLLESFVERGATVVVTTHLEGLKSIGFEDPRFSVASVTFDVEALRPTYKLRNGVPGGSYALRIASRLGLDAGVVADAERRLAGAEGAERQALLERMEAEFNTLSAARIEVDAVRAELARKEEEFENRAAKAAARDAAAVESEARELATEARTLRAEIRKVNRVLRNMAAPESEAEADALRQKLAEARAAADRADGLRKRAPQVAGTSADDARETLVPSSLQVGQTVWVATFKRSGELVELDSSARRAVVQIGPLRTNVSTEDLRASAQAEVAAAEAQTSANSGVRFEVERSAGNTVDLRGERVDEALDKLDAFLDRAARSSMPALFVIHGHGTGALKRAVRQHLAHTPYRLKWRPGEQGEGGDGATVIELG